MTSNPPSPPPTQTPYRQIRALYDDDTITVYQAYSAAIASAAVAAQRLDASAQFRTTRTTWIKPSWAWMLHRAGYSFKDPGQERILAIRVRRACFLGLLARAALTHAGSSRASENGVEDGGDGRERKGKKQKNKGVVNVQWDPERTVRLERLGYRSIQIGIPGELAVGWVADGIVGIEDVTERARELKRTLDERPGITDQELFDLGLVPRERPLEVSAELQATLGMTGQ